MVQLTPLIQVANSCLFDLVTVVVNHYNYKNSVNNKRNQIVLLFWKILLQPLQTL